MVNIINQKYERHYADNNIHRQKIIPDTHATKWRNRANKLSNYKTCKKSDVKFKSTEDFLDWNNKHHNVPNQLWAIINT